MRDIASYQNEGWRIHCTYKELMLERDGFYSMFSQNSTTCATVLNWRANEDYVDIVFNVTCGAPKQPFFIKQVMGRLQWVCLHIQWKAKVTGKIFL